MSETGNVDTARWWKWLLLCPFVGLLWVPFYDRVHPELWGIPFFFWYQFLWVPISALLTGLVYLKSGTATQTDAARSRPHRADMTNERNGP